MQRVSSSAHEVTSMLTSSHNRALEDSGQEAASRVISLEATP